MITEISLRLFSHDEIWIILVYYKSYISTNWAIDMKLFKMLSNTINYTDLRLISNIASVIGC